MRLDAAAGGNVPVLGGGELLATVSGLDEIADVEPIDFGLTPASHLQFDDLFRIHGAVEDALARDDVAGAVVVQGTDAIEETAFCFDLLHAGPKPIVVTGAMLVDLLLEGVPQRAAGDRQDDRERDDAVLDLDVAHHVELGDRALQLGVDDLLERGEDRVAAGLHLANEDTRDTVADS